MRMKRSLLISSRRLRSTRTPVRLFATLLLREAHFGPAWIDLVRTRDAKQLDECDIVVDVSLSLLHFSAKFNRGWSHRSEVSTTMPRNATTTINAVSKRRSVLNSRRSFLLLVWFTSASDSAFPPGIFAEDAEAQALWKTDHRESLGRWG